MTLYQIVGWYKLIDVHWFLVRNPILYTQETNDGKRNSWEVTLRCRYYTRQGFHSHIVYATAVSDCSNSICFHQEFQNLQKMNLDWELCRVET